MTGRSENDSVDLINAAYFFFFVFLAFFFTTFFFFAFGMRYDSSNVFVRVR